MARKKANVHYIYKTSCNVTGKWYVGMHSTAKLEDGYMGSGIKLRHSIRKYGIENHTKEILEFLPNRELLVIREAEIVNKELIADGFCMNLKEGGSGGFINKEHMIKCSKAGKEAFKLKMKNDENFSNKFKKLLLDNNKKAHENGSCKYDNFKNRKHSEETKNKIGEINKINQQGEKNSQFGTCWIVKSKKIKKEEINLFLEQGWKKGRKVL